MLKTREKTDAGLLADFVDRGDSGAFEDIVDHHSRAVYATCLSVLKDRHEAEDAAQATFLVLVKKASSLRKTVLAGWLFLTANNVARNALKAKIRRARREKENVTMNQQTSTTAIEGLPEETMAMLNPALASLPSRQRDALVLRYIHGLTREETAREIGCPSGTVHSRVKAGLEKLRRKLFGKSNSVPVLLIAGAMSESSSVPAPAGLSAVIKASCLGKNVAATAASALAKSTIKALAWAKIKLAAAAITSIAVLGAGGAMAIKTTAAEKTAVPAKTKTVLNTGSPWSAYIYFRKPVVSVAALKAAGKSASAPEPLPIRKLTGGRPTWDIQHLIGPPPPEKWANPDFNDLDWTRAKGSNFYSPPLQTGTICLRSSFQVSKPGSVSNLYLKMSFRGGAIVYLNGTEIARSHLPKGKLDLDTCGEKYPDKAFLNSAGKMHTLLSKTKKAEDKVLMASRDRSLGPVSIPVKLLRKGVNVLAVELRRSDFHPVALKWWKSKNLHFGLVKKWTPAGLLSIRLSARGSGFIANVEGCQDIHLWNSGLHSTIEVIPHGNPGQLPGPMVMTGARGGSFSSLLAVSSPKTITGLKARISALSGTAGKTIPTTAIRVSYLLESNVNHQNIWGWKKQAFNLLAEKAPAEVAPASRPKRYNARVTRARKTMGLPPKAPLTAAVAIVVTVNVPGDTAPGLYKGQLTVSAAGLPQKSVPVVIDVADWLIPEPLKMRTRMGIFQSPPTLALHYKTKIWSEEHWKLMEKSFRFLGEVGNDLVNIPISCETQFGNDEGMVHWIRQADGSFDYDFTVFDRYIKLVKKHLGVPKFVALHVWHAGAWKPRPVDEQNQVLVIDKKTGKREYLQVPVFGTPASKKFWTPVLMIIKKKLTAAGMEKSMCLGVLSDGTAPPPVFKMFKEILPGVGWTRGCHSTTFSKKPYGLKGGGTCVYHEFCYGLGLRDPAKKLPAIHTMTGPGTAWFRGEKDFRLPSFIYRTMAERGLFCETSGIGRLGLDLWSLPFKGKKGKAKYRSLFNRWPHSSVAGHGDPTLVALIHPGKEGPQRTLRFQIFREGLQESEALIIVSEAMVEHAAKIGPKLVAECKALLSQRINADRVGQGISERFHAGWQQRSSNLYNLASRLAKKIK
jgi:RNA polymerase sigma factor (sigma-70 family)